MGLYERIRTIKMNILPWLLYLFQSLPVDIPDTQFNKWDKLFSRFIWQGKRPKIRYNTLQIPKDRGGMALPNLREYFHAAHARPLLHWCNDDYLAQRKDIEVQKLFPIQTLLGERKVTPSIAKHIQINWIVTFALEKWFAVSQKMNLRKEVSLLKWIAFDN